MHFNRQDETKTRTSVSVLVSVLSVLVSVQELVSVLLFVQESVSILDCAGIGTFCVVLRQFFCVSHVSGPDCATWTAPTTLIQFDIVMYHRNDDTLAVCMQSCSSVPPVL